MPEITHGAPCWIDLSTSDVDASRRFYEELLGWTSEQAGEEYGGYVNFARDGAPVAGAMAKQDPAQPEAWSIYLRTDDAASVHDKAAAAGTAVMVPPMPVGTLGTMAFYFDADGAVVGGWQPGEHQGFATREGNGSPAWFELFTRDFEGAVAWYRDVFGWDVHVLSDTPEFRYATLGAGEDQLAGIMDASAFLPEGVPAHWSVYFRVADTDAAIEQAVGLGATVVAPAEDTPYGRLATLADPHGAMFKLLG